MLCRACQEAKSGGGKSSGGGGDSESGAARPRKRNGRARSQLCSRCGNLVSPPSEDMGQQVRTKQSQLARFGLDTPLTPLLERKPRKGDR